MHFYMKMEWNCIKIVCILFSNFWKHQDQIHNHMNHILKDDQLTCILTYFRVYLECTKTD